MKLRHVELFCGGGGSAVGYMRAYQKAGVEVEIVGVDIVPQPRFPFEFVQADALDFPLKGFQIVGASPPCQHYSLFSRNIGTYVNHPDLIGPTRAMLQRASVPYVIENVEHARAWLHNPVMLCGSSFGLRTDEGFGLRRHRLFESNRPLFAIECNHRFEPNSIGVYGHGTPQWFRKKHGRNARLSEWKEAMGIDWMTRKELTEAIPPAYTEFIGSQLIAQLENAA